MMYQMFERMLLIRTDFERIFFRNEYRALSGHHHRTIWALLAILFLTFLALGFAVGSLDNLQRKMDNPFTNWVDLGIKDGSVASKTSKIRERYEQTELGQSLHLNAVNGYTIRWLNFHHRLFDPLRYRPDTLTYTLAGRTIEADEPLFTTMVDPAGDNLIWRNPDVDWAGGEFPECDLVITEDLALKLGYENPETIQSVCISESGRPLFLRVAAVVRELPNLTFFACSPRLYNILTAKRDGAVHCEDHIIANTDGSPHFFVLTDTLETTPETLENHLMATFPGAQPPNIAEEARYRSGGAAWSLLRIAYLPADAPSLDSFRIAQKNAPVAAVEGCALECGGKGCGTLDFADLHYLAFHFERLDDIRKFRQDMLDQFSVEIDMGQVEAKENFALVSQLTFAISLILLGFGCLSIVLFVNNLLRTHLYEVRSNLGTFQAFGLDDAFLTRSYLKIIFSFLGLAIVLALLLTVVVDRSEQIIAGDESRFNLFSPWIVAAIVLLFISSLTLTYRTIHRILGDTPGNLIYER